MLEQLNKLDLPLKYAVLLMAAASIATPVFYFAGLYSSADHAVLAPVAAAVGGYIGGLMRRSMGRTE